MPGMAAKVIITERQQQMLQTMAFSRGCPQGLAHRAEIILLAFDGFTNEEIAVKLQCERHGVGICEPPDQSGRPLTHWTPRELADEAVERGIATSISVRQVGRFLKGGGASTARESVLAQRRSRGRGGF